MTDEEDYMSDAFLIGLDKVDSSIITQRHQKRQWFVTNQQKQLIEKQKAEKRMRSGIIDKDKLVEDLKKPLTTDNKGYQMLARMGYKPGQSLGKIVGISEPVKIQLKTDRHGLGLNVDLKTELKKFEEVNNTSDFRKRVNQKAEERSMLNNLKHCQVSCENLDRENNLTTPKIIWFWPEIPETEENTDIEEGNDDRDDKNETETSNLTNQEKIDILTLYLRTTYLFCFWCGTRYIDENDLKNSCPGMNKDDH